MPEPQSSEAQGAAHWSALLSSWLKELDTDGRGLSRGEASRRLRRVEPNRVTVGQARSVRQELLALVGNPLLLVLGLAAAISAGTGNWLDATIIAVTVGVSLVLDGVPSHLSLRAAAALRRSVSLRAAVWRDAGWEERPVEELVPGDRIRLTPGQKTRVLEALRQAGEVVGYLGDGINDAPSLRRADVGLSVDSAVDVAREAASVILTRSDLGALHLGVLEGRRSFANVLKYVLMGTASNFGNLVSMAAAAVLLPFLPMMPMQVLLNNLLYDLAQVAIPADRVNREELARPGRWSVPLNGRFMRPMGPLSSLFDLATFALLWGAFQARPELFRTGWFIESTWTQTLVIFVVRTRRSPLESRPSAALVVGVVAVCLVAAALPCTVVGAALGFQPPPAGVLLALAVMTAIYLWCAEALKRRFFANEEDAARAASGPYSGSQRARRDSNARPPA